MYKHILVAVDGSDTSELALDEAIGLAKEGGAQLRIVHAIDEVTLNWDTEYVEPETLRQGVVKAGLAVLDKAKARVAEAGLSAEIRLVEIEILGRRIPQAIADEAEAWPADLIVAGTHGRRGLSHLFLGSVAEGIARVATKPVLLVRGK